MMGWKRGLEKEKGGRRGACPDPRVGGGPARTHAQRSGGAWAGLRGFERAARGKEAAPQVKWKVGGRHDFTQAGISLTLHTSSPPRLPPHNTRLVDAGGDEAGLLHCNINQHSRCHPHAPPGRRKLKGPQGQPRRAAVDSHGRWARRAKAAVAGAGCCRRRRPRRSKCDASDVELPMGPPGGQLFELADRFSNAPTQKDVKAVAAAAFDWSGAGRDRSIGTRAFKDPFPVPPNGRRMWLGLRV